MPVHEALALPPSEDTVEQLPRRLGPLDRCQVLVWQAMSGVRRLELAFQAYQFALDLVRLTERRPHPSQSPEELNWRITRRMKSDPDLGA